MLRAFATVVLVVSALVPSTSSAQIKEFPYEARVVAEEAFIRSGAGESYYPTQKLPRETTVTVHRHDPGGWYMIDPPQGSFSWIPERFVKRLSDTEGEVTDENSAVWVGSDFGDEVSVFQRRMKAGEKVTILGQREIDTDSGIQSMLKIAPPARERRWIPGSAVVPADPLKRQQANTDPYAVPGNAKRPDGAIVTPKQTLDSRTAMHGGVSDVPEIGPSEQLTRLQLMRGEQQRLASIDHRFREMILQNSSTWDLDAIESDYRSLQQSASHKPVSGQIDMRYPAIERYRRRLVQLQDVKQLTSRTEVRDAELLARHSGGTSGPGTPTPALPTQSIASAGPESVQIAGQSQQLSDAFATFLAGAPTAVPSAGDVIAVGASGTDGSPPSTNVLPASSPQNRYIGAGIVQRVAAEGQSSGFVLMTPSGRVLADLKPTGDVRLEAFVGQQVGVQGSRWSENDKRDMIEVSALETVRIRQ